MLRLYKCIYEDANFLYNLRNELETRKNSFKKKKINYINHLLWLKKKLSDTNCKIYILKKKNLKIGQIRFDLLKNQAEIDFSITQEFRNKGFGRILLARGIRLKFLQNYQIVGKVLKGNKSSIKLFEQLKFNKIIKKSYVLFYK